MREPPGLWIRKEFIRNKRPGPFWRSRTAASGAEPVGPARGGSRVGPWLAPQAARAAFEGL